VRFHFHSEAVHTNWLADAVLSVDGEAALDDVDNFAVVRNGHRLGGIQGAVYVILVNYPTGNTHDAAAVHGSYVRARQAHQGAVDFVSRGALCFFNRTRDGLCGGIHVRYRPSADSLGRLNADAQDAQVCAVFHAGDQSADF